MKKQLLLFMFMLVPMLASADAVEIDGIYYNLITKAQQAEVTSNPNKYTGSVVIPEKVTYEGVEYNVTSIGGSAFQNCTNLTSITIPNSVTSIGNNAFSNCGLASITIPNSVTSIGKHAFESCNITSITIPNSITTISSYAFAYCRGLTSVTIPNSVTSIESSAFLGCSGLTSITIPNSVTTIGEAAFSGCTGLTSITIPNSLTSIESSAFTGCSSLTSITIPNSVTSIESSAFSHCSSLTSITIPNGVKKIGAEVFKNCTSLTSITFPNSVTSIGSYAFQNCTSLAFITFPDNLSDIPNSFQNCTSLTSITIPNSVSMIGGQAFYGCTSLTTITIGSGVKSIWASAFAKCPELKDVYCLAENIPTTASNAFEGSYIEYATLHVPDASVSAYSNAEPWKNFGSIVGINGGGEAQKCATPTISYGGKKLTFGCATEGVEYVSEIKDADVKTHYGADIDLSATYEISVYATKSSYTNSDVATATLVWTSASFTETTSAPGMVNAAAYDIPVLIQSNGGTLTVQGAVNDGTPVSVYSVNGTQAGATVIQDGQAQVATSLQPGSIAIVKIGQKSVKVVVK